MITLVWWGVILWVIFWGFILLLLIGVMLGRTK